jgi:hypothetical protein
MKKHFDSDIDFLVDRHAVPREMPATVTAQPKAWKR